MEEIYVNYFNKWGKVYNPCGRTLWQTKVHSLKMFPNPSQQSSQSNPSTSSSSSGSTGLPPLVLNSRLHELVIAGTGQNERLEPALEHVKPSYLK